MKTYALSMLTLIIGGYDLSGGGEDEFVKVEFPDMGEMTTGADGFKTFNGSHDKGAKVTITVMPTSQAYEYLCALCAAQRVAIRDGAQLSALNFRLEHPATGDKIVSQHGAFVNEGMPTFGKTVSEVSFVIELADAQTGRKPN